MASAIVATVVLKGTPALARDVVPAAVGSMLTTTVVFTMARAPPRSMMVIVTGNEPRSVRTMA